ncbi:hypothetical protein VCHC51A1_3613 [Vibrio cholerae HC-51A1]|nr:hypothetical protein VCHC02A1_0735 [Vibrio cholerae HC-02A1]EKG53148.1 hypothetical protein VCHC50A1_0741 [Vibrio cholerae HC-50A1]EKG58047.1 hypothetical protein VCHC52A1_0743 [Vibrio cholerae HC-52A1]EKG63754.1 hypothetical protein VCHC56A1_0829 [Vibrio cholerae HC-56A1]EKG64176.1 hypothetical protein VCHC55A1_0744 [Vibrio cholerae HC-55A1]EKG66146.1 hypothetical protein VCHC57A1_3695 [Vibrio cholerae HC-57A1]EKG87381.1 hypothetical protein VCHC51A1_3613 [Vibrio cholerae HC-51A1]EKK9487
MVMTYRANARNPYHYFAHLFSEFQKLISFDDLLVIYCR